MLAWLFLDMDAFFAACEQQARPKLRGKPVGVLPVMSRTSCCIAASYEAKAFGIKTGTRVWEARDRCQEVIFVEARPAFYVQIHKAICKAVDQIAPIQKVYSIDEMAIKLAPNQRTVESATQLAKQIKQQIHQDVGSQLSLSIGIASTRLLAKIASDLDKPNGLSILLDTQLPDALTHLKLTDLPGIGQGMSSRLARHDIHTIQTLWQQSRKQFQSIWGSIDGLRYYDALHGIDHPDPITHRHSFSHANILSPQLRHHDGAYAVMTRLLHKACARLRQEKYFTHRLDVNIKLQSEHHWYGNTALPPCQDTQTVLEHFKQIWDNRPLWAQSKQDPPTKVSITVGHLSQAQSTTGNLFTHTNALNDKRQKLAHVMDQLNQAHQAKHGNTHAIYFGGMHPIAQTHMPDKIAFGRVPDEQVRM